MTRFLAGVVLGLLLGSAATALAARLVGNDGYLLGWTVIDRHDRKICDEPFVWTGTRELQCD